jgi:small subunit ribosomal protein S16
MAVVLRLARQGSKKAPFYRIVACDGRSPRNGRFLEQLGTYDPRQDPAVVRLDDDRLTYWLSKGAQPSDTVGEIIERKRKETPAAQPAPGR